MKELVSIIIPAYNAEGFIGDTVKSVLTQSYPNMELIIVNDGSTDSTAEVVKKISDDRIKLINRSNNGVSSSRNYGLEVSKGDYVVFFDADDIMPIDFIKSRLVFLVENPFFNFVTSWVQKIDEHGSAVEGLMKSACNDLQNEILLYHSDIITCPSGYLFRKVDLINNNLKFDVNLSSAADRYFLLQIDKVLKGHFLLDTNICLNYRIRTESMSNKLNENLIHDNELFYRNVLENIKPNYRIRKMFLSKSNYILFGAYFKTGHYFMSMKHAIISFFLDPLNFIKTFFKKNLDIYYFQ